MTMFKKNVIQHDNVEIPSLKNIILFKDFIFSCT